MGIFIFIRIEKKHSYYHSQKRGRIPMFRPLFIYSLELKFLLRSLISSFFNTLMVARSSIRLILKSRSGCVENSWFSLLEDCPPLCSCRVFNFWNENAIAQGFFPAFFRNSYP